MPRHINKPVHLMRNETITSSRATFDTMLAQFPERMSILAEGDSWFKFPPDYILFGELTNIINMLGARGDCNILQMARNGDEALSIMSGDSRLRLIDTVQQYHFDFLFFSAGGNDVVGGGMFDFLLKKGHIASSNWQDYVHHDRIARKIRQVKDVYSDMIEYCIEYARNPNMRIVSHCYDYALPGKQARFLGGIIGIKPWLAPYLKEHGRDISYPISLQIIRHLIDGLAEMQQELAQQYPGKFIAVNTRNTLGENDWHDELHPTPEGFAQMTQKIIHHLEKEGYFPEAHDIAEA